MGDMRKPPPRELDYPVARRRRTWINSENPHRTPRTIGSP
jgi:hypothetical protein